MKTIAIIEDEQDIANLISINLQKSGFKTVIFYDGTSLFSYLNKKQVPDLVILDIMLPDMDGLEICKLLKKNPDFSMIPIIFLTAKGEEIDKILGLELGADDYITKPFSTKELIARIKTILRRSEMSKDYGNKKIVIKNITIDPEKYEVFINNKKIELTLTEFKILYLLASKNSFTFTRRQILEYLWGNEKAVIDRTIDVHIKHLREKMGNNIIKNIRGVGYRINL
ncbi:MAG: response regulator transcription factor [Candidatus Omnitrophica bacterium]|jgi:two-component system phosphate regulon response regulator PhoB/two-component system alkaline phosphatase synthesis response regulator PhoP|nr:response regulator transcription factor [Candidatus Omnitrophota bacterium]